MPGSTTALEGRLFSPGPKRILALDGGGLKGVISLGFLEKIENTLAGRYALAGVMPEKEFRLHHYFDLIGGTSTGAIIAALLAVTGHSVREIKEMYLQLGKKIFHDKNGFNLFGTRIYLNGKYDATPLKEELENIFGNARLGDGTNKTGLCIVTKRLDTCSTWPVTNNPKGRFFDNNQFLVKDIVRASTAAPSYFAPEVIDVGSGQLGVFVDGGMSMMNNPSLQLFLVATLKGFRLGWETGEDNLFIVSVGTGRRNKKLIGKKWYDPNLLDIAKFAPEQFMSDANDLVELLMHYVGKGYGEMRKIDTEVEDLSEDTMHGGKACSYLRYDVEMVKDQLDEFGLHDVPQDLVASLMEMDMSKNLELLARIGDAAGYKMVKAEHFPHVFDLSH